MSEINLKVSRVERKMQKVSQQLTGVQQGRDYLKTVELECEQIVSERDQLSDLKSMVQESRKIERLIDCTVGLAKQ